MFNLKCIEYCLRIFVFIGLLGFIAVMLCFTIFAANNPKIMKVETKRLSTNVLSRDYIMLSQDCLFTKVVVGDLCVDIGITTDVFENSNYIERDNSVIRRYKQGDEFCLSIKNTNTIYSCENEPAYIVITPTMFNSNSRTNNVVLSWFISSYVIVLSLALIIITCWDIFIALIKFAFKKLKQPQQPKEPKDEEMQSPKQLSDKDVVEKPLGSEPMLDEIEIEELKNKS